MNDTPRNQHTPEELEHTESPDTEDFGLAFFEDLERNLLASQQALVWGDLNRLEDLTREQALFERKLASLLASRVPVSASSLEGQREVRAVQMRILDLGRVHMALLARREQGLRTLRHRMAGLESLYGPMASGPEHGAERRPMRAREA